MQQKVVQGKQKDIEAAISWRTLQTWLRQRRFRFFKELMAEVPRPAALLDVGGTPEYWEKMEFQDEGIAITLYNLEKAVIARPGMVGIVGDACDMREFSDQQFEIVFSNSVIEHVGTYEQQRLMAQEIQRIGKRYCVQTPNRYFIIEPHVLLPFFQFLPFGLQVWILTRFSSPWGWRLASQEEAIQYIQSIRLLTGKELRQLFPGAAIYRERVLGLTKSFTIYKW